MHSEVFVVSPPFSLFPSLFIPCSCHARSTFFPRFSFVSATVVRFVGFSTFFSCSFPLLLFVSSFSSRVLFVSLGILMRATLLFRVHSCTVYWLSTFVVWLYRNQIITKVDVLVQPAPLVYKATRYYIKSETAEYDVGEKEPSEAHVDDFSPPLLVFLAASRSSHYCARKKRKVGAEWDLSSSYYYLTRWKRSKFK